MSCEHERLPPEGRNPISSVGKALKMQDLLPPPKLNQEPVPQEEAYQDHVRSTLLGYCASRSHDISMKYAYPGAKIPHALDEHSYSKLPFAEHWVDSTVHVSQTEADEIQHQTILQGDCKRWHKEREWRVTASKFGEIVKSTQRRDMELLCENILNPPDLRCAAVMHGQTYEKQAIETFTELTGIKVENCGLYVNPEYPHLGATPDALIHPDGLVEVKCPFKGRNSAIEIMSATFKSDFPFLKIENDRIVLNHTHNYYYQIQGQMGIARKSCCYFIVYTFEDIFIEKISFDENFFTGTMVPALNDFYERRWRPFLARKIAGVW